MTKNPEGIDIVYGMLCVVISINDKLVILKRSPEKKVMPNLWAVVGAYPFLEKPDMTQVAVAEIKDELNLEGTVLEVGNEIISKLEIEGKVIELHVTPVLAKVESEDVTLNSEHTEYKWIEYDQLYNLELAPGMLEAIEAVNTKSYLRK